MSFLTPNSLMEQVVEEASTAFSKLVQQARQTEQQQNHHHELLKKAAPRGLSMSSLIIDADDDDENDNDSDQRNMHEHSHGLILSPGDAPGAVKDLGSPDSASTPFELASNSQTGTLAGPAGAKVLGRLESLISSHVELKIATAILDADEWAVKAENIEGSNLNAAIRQLVVIWSAWQGILEAGAPLLDVGGRFQGALSDDDILKAAREAWARAAVEGALVLRQRVGSMLAFEPELAREWDSVLVQVSKLPVPPSLWSEKAEHGQLSPREILALGWEERGLDDPNDLDAIATSAGGALGLSRARLSSPLPNLPSPGTATRKALMSPGATGRASGDAEAAVKWSKSRKASDDLWAHVDTMRKLLISHKNTLGLTDTGPWSKEAVEVLCGSMLEEALRDGFETAEEGTSSLPAWIRGWMAFPGAQGGLGVPAVVFGVLRAIKCYYSEDDRDQEWVPSSRWSDAMRDALRRIEEQVRLALAEPISIMVEGANATSPNLSPKPTRGVVMILEQVLIPVGNMLCELGLELETLHEVGRVILRVLMCCLREQASQSRSAMTLDVECLIAWFESGIVSGGSAGSGQESGDGRTLVWPSKTEFIEAIRDWTEGDENRP